jgi:hypothetical protein
MAHFHWGDQRARTALTILRNLGLLEKETEETQAQEEKAGGPVGPVAAGVACHSKHPATEPQKKTGIGTSHRENVVEQQNRQQHEQHEQHADKKATENGLTDDARKVLDGIEKNLCAPTARAVAQHFGWGTHRALAALRQLRKDGRLENK